MDISPIDLKKCYCKHTIVGSLTCFGKQVTQSSHYNISNNNLDYANNGIKYQKYQIHFKVLTFQRPKVTPPDWNVKAPGSTKRRQLPPGNSDSRFPINPTDHQSDNLQRSLVVATSTNCTIQFIKGPAWWAAIPIKVNGAIRSPTMPHCLLYIVSQYRLYLVSYILLYAAC